MLRLSFVVVALAMGCSRPPPDPVVSAAVRAYCGERAVEVEKRIDALLPRLSLDQKVSLMHGTFALDHGAWPSFGVDELGIPTLRMIDGPRGISRAAGPATAFPVAMARGAGFDPDLERRIGEAIGRETRAAGAAVILAPTMNVLHHPRWGRAQETYGEDPAHIGALALAFVEGAQRHVLATAKHFAVNSIENTRFTVDVTVDEKTLREVYLPHFRRVVVEGRVATVMSAYNSVNGSYCSENQHLLRDILKGEWSFAGPVMSDWIFGTHDTVKAAKAGLDLEMPNGKIYGSKLVAAVDDGRVPVALVDDAVRRLLRARFCYRVDSDPPVRDPAKRETPEHRALAREAAERGLVLLQNRGDLLPLDRGRVKKVVVTGKLADVENIGDLGSSSVMPSSVVTALEGMRATGLDVTHLAAPPTAQDDPLLKAADAVIVVAGLVAADEGEAQVGAGDRASLALPADQVAWVRAVAAKSDRVVLVLEGGAALTVGDLLPEVEAVLFAWYPGMEGGTALARVILGESNPSGRLPIAFPRREEDLPPFDNQSNQVTYAPLHGYRHLDAQKIDPLFPFGFGLSYTTFTVGNLRALGARATCDVTNGGKRAGRHTVQAYANRALAGFTQVELAAGETRAVTIDLRGLAAGSYTLEVGSSSRDLPLSTTLRVD